MKGAKLVEIPYFLNQIEENDKDHILIVGECVAVDNISDGILKKGCKNVTTTDMRNRPEDGWLIKNTNWPHIVGDFVEFPGDQKYDKIIAVSIFEHFGLVWDNMPMHQGEKGTILWNHDIKGILKAGELLRDENSKLIITVPAGPFFNYNVDGEPILRGYDYIRQHIIKKKLSENSLKITNEIFYFSQDFEQWHEADPEINEPRFFNIYNSFTPNVIWAFTVKKV